MVTFSINLNKLNEFQASLDSNNKKASGIIDQIFLKMSQVDQIWNDPNTETFKKQIKLDQDKIDQFNENAQKMITAISDFLNSLINISRQCNSGVNGNFIYNGTQAKNTINNCESAYSFIQNAKSRLDYADIPVNFKYRDQLKNMKYQILDINERLKTVKNDLNGVINSIETAFNNIQSSPKMDSLQLKQMSYANQTTSATLTDSSGLVTDAKASQNLNANRNNVDYNEQDSTFISNAQRQIYSGEQNNFEENDSTFVNQSSRATLQNSSTTFDEVSSTFQNSAQKQQYNEKLNNFEETQSTFTNSESATQAKANTINVENVNSTFNNQTASTSYNGQNREFSSTTSNFFNPAEAVSTNGEVINTTNNDINVNINNEN